MLPVGSNTLKEGQRLRSLPRRNDRNLPQKDRFHLDMSNSPASCCSSEALGTLCLSTFTILLMCTFITCREMMLRRERGGKKGKPHFRLKIDVGERQKALGSAGGAKWKLP